MNNESVKKDATNNFEPQQIISRLTGYTRNVDLFNYQVSHIFGRTKNIFLLEAPWNIALIPKIIDPFTGHETTGVWPGAVDPWDSSSVNNSVETLFKKYI